MNPIQIPTPSEVTNKPSITPVQGALVWSLIEILQNEYTWSTIYVTLKQILQWVEPEVRKQTKSHDRDKLELIMSKHGRRMKYDGPAYNESYDSNYEISGQKK